MNRITTQDCDRRPAWITVSLLIGALVLGPAPARASTYTFEGLSTGILQGQDNWTTNGQGTVSGVNVTAPLGSGNPSSRAVEGDTTVLLYQRVNNGNFAIPALGAGRHGIFQIDSRLSTDTLAYSTFGVGHDLNNDGFVVVSELGFRLGTETGNAGVITVARHVGDELNATFASLGIGNQDWVRVRMDVDFDAFGGNAAGSVSYQDLTLGQTTFTPVSGLQNIFLGLTLAPAVSTWDALVVDLRNAAQGDNLLVDSVPEPSTLLLLLGGGWLVWRRGRRRA